MRDLVYILKDGTEVKTLAEAKSSGQSYVATVKGSGSIVPKSGQ